MLFPDAPKRVVKPQNLKPKAESPYSSSNTPRANDNNLPVTMRKKTFKLTHRKNICYIARVWGQDFLDARAKLANRT